MVKLSYKNDPELYSYEAERAVINYLMFYDKAIFYLPSEFTEDVFYSDDIRTIFKVIKRLTDAGRVADAVAVNDILNHEQNGQHYTMLLSDILQSERACSSNVFKEHCDIIIKHSLNRRLVKFSMYINDELTKNHDVKITLDNIEKKFYEINSWRSVQYHTMGDAVRELLKYTQDVLDDKIKGISTGYPEIDLLTGGMRGGQLIVIAGRPKMGKTTLATNFFINQQKEANIGLLSLEMTLREITWRITSNVSGIPLFKIMNPRKMSEGNMQSYVDTLTRKIGDMPIFVQDKKGLFMHEVKSLARWWKAKHDIKALYIDQLSYIKYDIPGQKYVSRVLVYEYVLAELKELACQLDIPIIVMAQINRNVDERADKRPIMSDLKDSGAIEEKADLILGVYRDDVYNANSTKKGIAEIIILAQRNGPANETVELLFESACNNFVSIPKIDGGF